MSVRQYIGARYVTKIYENTLDPSSAEWQASVNYEPLTLVTYNNGSYLSKKQVPASVGNPAANPSYWVQTGFYNGQIAQLQNDVNTLISEVSLLVNNTRVIMVSDSYGNRTNNDGATFIEIVKSEMGLSNDDFYHGTSGGASIGGSSNTYLDIISGLSVTSPDTISDIYVVGGANDATRTASEILTGFTNLVTYCSTNFINAKIHFIPVGMTFTDEYCSKMKETELPAIESARDLGIKVCENAQYCLMDSDLLASDLVHPNEDGVDAVASCVLGYVYTGKYDKHVTKRITTGMTISMPEHTSVTYTGNSLQAVLIKNNGSAKLAGFGNPGFVHFATTSAFTLAKNESVVVTLDKRNLYNYLFGSTRMQIPAFIYATSLNEFVPASCVVRSAPDGYTFTFKLMKSFSTNTNSYDILLDTSFEL